MKNIYVLHRLNNNIPATHMLTAVAEYLSYTFEVPIHHQLQQDAIPIVIDAHTYQNAPNRPHIVFNTEQLQSDSPQVSEWYRSFLNGHIGESENTLLKLDYSMANGGSSGAIIPIGYVPEWAARFEQKVDRDIDVLFVGALNPRRINILEQVAADKSINIQVATGVFGAELDKLLLRTKVLLNVHYYPCKQFEPFRCIYAAHSGAKIISEDCVDTSIKFDAPGGIDRSTMGLNLFEYAEVVDFKLYDDLADAVKKYLKSDVELGISSERLLHNAFNPNVWRPFLQNNLGKILADKGVEV